MLFVFFENQEAVSLSQEAEAWSISSTNINISGYGPGSGTVTVTAPASGSWSIDFASNAFSLNASPTSGTGSKTVTINAINDSGQTGMYNIDIYLKSGGSTKDTGNISCPYNFGQLIVMVGRSDIRPPFQMKINN